MLCDPIQTGRTILKLIMDVDSHSKERVKQEHIKIAGRSANSCAVYTCKVHRLVIPLLETANTMEGKRVGILN